MQNVKNALANLQHSIAEPGKHTSIPYHMFLKLLSDNPNAIVRSIFQVFHDMITIYVGEGIDEYPDDPESINYVHYNTSQLFVDGVDHPFFADRLFANRLFNLISSLRRGAQQNKVYIFEGPPGCGKSTFLNNLLHKFEEYANSADGVRYEIIWRLDRKMLGGYPVGERTSVLEKLTKLLNLDRNETESHFKEQNSLTETDEYVEVPCPSHDNPLLIIPKRYRREFFDHLFKNDEFKWKLYTEKEYEWVFKENPCTICTSLYESVIEHLDNASEVFEMIYARRYQFNRRLGDGISVFNPGDKPLQKTVLTNPMLQERIDTLLRDSNRVRFIYSTFAKTNNGIYSLMDIKSHNKERLIDLHNIISEGIHKVEDIEENVNSLFLTLMNPEDKAGFENIQSFSDRIEYIKIPYVMDYKTEVAIYRNIFGKHIDANFLPKILENFARIIIATRLRSESDALNEWIMEKSQYYMYCDKNLHLLKMEFYSGHIPAWLSEEDRKKLNAKRRRKIIAESENEGEKGLSGRDSIKIFNEFYSTFAKEDKLINMSMLNNYFTKIRKDLAKYIPDGFLESLTRLYNYHILQEVKESLYYYNKDRIAKDIQNYLFAINFEPVCVEKCIYTKEKLEITYEFFERIETHILGGRVEKRARESFRWETQRAYATKTLTQEILVEGKQITETELFHSLLEKYEYNLKEKVLDPFMENENFRMAIKDFETDAFKTYDKRIRDDVAYLIGNLTKRYSYTQQGAKEVCMYVIDNDLAKKFIKK